MESLPNSGSYWDYSKPHLLWSLQWDPEKTGRGLRRIFLVDVERLIKQDRCVYADYCWKWIRDTWGFITLFPPLLNVWNIPLRESQNFKPVTTPGFYFHKMGWLQEHYNHRNIVRNSASKAPYKMLSYHCYYGCQHYLPAYKGSLLPSL